MLTPEQEAHNAEIAYWHAIAKDGPARRWWHASLDRAPIYRALRIDPTDPFACYAVAPFRLIRADDGQWRVWSAHPCPAILDDPDVDWLGIETVIEWNPVNDTARVVGDPVPQLVGSLSDDANVIFASPRAFFQAWAMRRAQYVAHRKATSAHWQSPPKERDEVPGALTIGSIDKIRWNPATMPEHIECVGIDPHRLNAALLKAAHLPRAVTAPSHMKAAA